MNPRDISSAAFTSTTALGVQLRAAQALNKVLERELQALTTSPQARGVTRSSTSNADTAGQGRISPGVSADAPIISQCLRLLPTKGDSVSHKLREVVRALNVQPEEARDTAMRLAEERLRADSELKESSARVSSLQQENASKVAELDKTQKPLEVKSAEAAELGNIRRDHEDTILSLKGRLSSNRTRLSEIRRLTEATSTRAAALLQETWSPDQPPREPVTKGTPTSAAVPAYSSALFSATFATPLGFCSRPRALIRSAPLNRRSALRPIEVSSGDGIKTEKDARDHLRAMIERRVKRQQGPCMP